MIMIISKVILCTKANNEKAREAAFNLVVEIGNSTIYHGDKSKEGSTFLPVLIHLIDNI